MTFDPWLEAYEKMLEEHGPTFRGVGYSRRGCLMQYQTFRETVGVKAGDRVLDVGCGLGFGSYILSDCQYTGIDASARMINAAVAMHEDAERVFVQGAMADFMPTKDHFDWVLMMGIFNLLYKWVDVKRVVSEGWAAAGRGLGVVFLMHARNPRPGHSVFALDKWLGLGLSLTPRLHLRTDWGDNQALLTLYRKKE